MNKIKLCIGFVFLLLTQLFSQNIDIDILREINLNRNKSLDGILNFITNSAFVPEIGIPIGMIAGGYISKDNVLRNKGFVVAASGVTASLLVTILKHSINRTRPFISYPELDKQTSGGSPSFPSGHSSSAFSLATALSIQFPKWYVIAPAYTWASLVGYSRMHLGVHYPSDVFVGALLGTGSSFLTFYANRWLFKSKKQTPKSETF